MKKHTTHEERLSFIPPQTNPARKTTQEFCPFFSVVNSICMQSPNTRFKNQFEARQRRRACNPSMTTNLPREQRKETQESRECNDHALIHTYSWTTSPTFRAKMPKFPAKKALPVLPYMMIAGTSTLTLMLLCGKMLPPLT